MGSSWKQENWLVQHLRLLEVKVLRTMELDGSCWVSLIHRRKTVINYHSKRSVKVGAIKRFISCSLRAGNTENHNQDLILRLAHFWGAFIQDFSVGKCSTRILPQSHKNYNWTTEQPSLRTAWNLANRSLITKDYRRSHIKTGVRAGPTHMWRLKLGGISWL